MKKITSLPHMQEPVFASYELLTRGLSDFFKEQRFVYVDPLNVDYRRQLLIHSDPSEVLNCVLVGGVCARLMDAEIWLNGNYRLWVLSHSAKNLLVRLFAVPENSVHVISREVLFAPSSLPRSFELNLPTSFVYAGRFASAKGVQLLIEVVRCLQIDYALPVELVLAGQYSEMIPHNKRGQVRNNKLLMREIQHQLNQDAWVYRPKIISGLSSSEWQQLPIENPVLVSLSQHTHEDFAVSVAQAQQLGWPTILSSWGAHLDCSRSNNFFVGGFDVFADSKKRKRMASSIAASLVRQWKTKIARTQAIAQEAGLRDHKLQSKKYQQDHSRLASLSAVQLQSIRAYADSKYPGILEASKAGLFGFINCKAGKRFYRDFDSVMLGK